MIEASGDLTLQTNSFIGEQQFLFNRDYDQSYTQSKVYIKAGDFRICEAIEKNCNEFIAVNYPGATFDIAAQQNIFEKIFEASETPLVVEVSLMKEKEVPPVEVMTALVDNLAGNGPTPEFHILLLKIRYI